MMRIFIPVLLILFTSVLPAAGSDLQPGLLWWSLHNPQGQSTATAPTDAWIATLHFGTPFKDHQLFSAQDTVDNSRLSSWVRHTLPGTAAIPLLPKKNSYTVPPAPRPHGKITLLGARYQGEAEQFSGSSVTPGTTIYPKAIIADRNPCTTPEGSQALTLSIEEIPLEIIPVGTIPKQGLFKPASWQFVLKVLYMGRPLADCPVTIHTADERTMDMATDEKGLFSITSQQERPVTRQWEHYLFTATSFDSDQNMEHTATLKVTAPPPIYGTGNIIRRALYIGVALGILVFAALMAAVALTPDAEPKKQRRR
jgi:hypothetical protein